LMCANSYLEGLHDLLWPADRSHFERLGALALRPRRIGNLPSNAWQDFVQTLFENRVS
jgi:hypothetical protein